MAVNGMRNATTSASLRGSIPCLKTELNLDITLACGQAFRWKVSADGDWTGVIGRHVCTLRQTETSLLYCVHSPPPLPQEAHSDLSSYSAAVAEPQQPAAKRRRRERSGGDVAAATTATPTAATASPAKPTEHWAAAADDADRLVAAISDYFRLSFNLGELYSQWAAKDQNFAQKAINCTGVRMLRQDPVETLFSFICSSNNNIVRITSMVDSLCERFGEKLGTYEGRTYFAFPSITRLAEPDIEASLRSLGFGYRAKFIRQTAQSLVQRHCGPINSSCHDAEAWLLSLRERPYDEVIAELTQLSGVGRKVADCIALMSLDKLDAVPVDTHVFQIACRDYHIPDVKGSKSMTDKVYSRIGSHFRELYGSYAGWAHTVLFSADLKKFKTLVK